MQSTQLEQGMMRTHNVHHPEDLVQRVHPEDSVDDSSVRMTGSHHRLNSRQKEKHRIACHHAEDVVRILASPILLSLVQAETKESDINDEDGGPVVRDPVAVEWIAVGADIYTWRRIISRCP